MQMQYLYSKLSNCHGATPIYLGFFSKKTYLLRRDLLCCAQKVLCNHRHTYSIRHGNSIAQSRIKEKVAQGFDQILDKNHNSIQKHIKTSFFRPQEHKLAALRRRFGSLNNKPIIRHTSTSKAREEKVKNEGPTAKNPLKKPGMMRQHHGIPVILQNKLQKSDIKSNDDKPKKPIVANAAQLKV